MIRRRTFLGAVGALGLGALTGCKARRTSLAGGPYVQDVRPEQATVATLTEQASGLELRWWPLDGAGAGGPGGRVSEAAGVQAHGLVATGLRPATSYGYVVQGKDGGGVLGEATFRTAPAPDARRLTFVALGDSGGTEASYDPALDLAEQTFEQVAGTKGDTNQQGRVVNAILASSRPDLVLHTGDVVYPDGSRAQYAKGFFEPFAPLIAQVPIYPIMGNHDTKTEGGAPFLETFFLPTNGPGADGRTYSFDWGPAHVTCYDVTTAMDDPQKLAWLEADLRATDRPWKILTFHEPPWGASKHADNDTLIAALVPIIDRCGVDLVLNGNDHLYARFFPLARATYIVTGGGGKSLYPVRQDPRIAYAESVFHFVEGVIDGGELRLRAVDAEGRTFDQVTLKK